MITLALPMSRAPFLPPHGVGGNQGLEFLEQAAFQRVEDQFARQAGRLASEQCQGHDVPANDGVDGDGDGQRGGALVLVGLDAAAALQDAVPLLDAPALVIPARAAQRLRCSTP